LAGVAGELLAQAGGDLGFDPAVGCAVEDLVDEGAGFLASLSDLGVFDPLRFPSLR